MWEHSAHTAPLQAQCGAAIEYKPAILSVQTAGCSLIGFTNHSMSAACSVQLLSFLAFLILSYYVLICPSGLLAMDILTRSIKTMS